MFLVGTTAANLHNLIQNTKVKNETIHTQSTSTSLASDVDTQGLGNASRTGCSFIGKIRVCIDRGSLRIQFPSTISQEYWGQRQKYFYPGLCNNPLNLLLAELALKQIEVDIASDLFDPSFEKYKKLIEEHRTEPPEPKQFGLVEQITNRVNRVVGRISLYELFTQYCEYKESILEETTYKLKYQDVYGRLLKKCPQDLNKPLSIRKYIVENRSSLTAKRVLKIIGSMLEWAKSNGIIRINVLNPFNLYADEIKPIVEKIPPTSVQQLLDAGILEENEELIAYSSEEALEIIRAFEDYTCRRGSDSATDWDRVVKFLFWTGCRTGEGMSVQWGDVSPDCSRIIFRSTYNSRLHLRKGLKTRRKGVTSRIFNCGAKLQKLLLNKKAEIGVPKPEQYLFTNSRNNNPFCATTLQMIWAGKTSEQYGFEGIVPKLIREGKVSCYLSIYATRHTFINIQLANGMKVADIARLVGNSPATIHRNYESPSKSPQAILEL